jgi:CBS domain-containing protein
MAVAVPTPPAGEEPAHAGCIYSMHMPRSISEKEDYMAQHVRDVMTPKPVTLAASSTLVDAALAMRDFDVEAVVVLDNNQIYGIATDRDIVIRGIANGNYPATTTLAEVCSRDLVTVAPSDSIDDVICLMRDKAIRRVPVVENGRPVGIVSIGALASALKAHSAEADRNDTPPHR